MSYSHTSAVILAAGKGTRLGQHLPKALYPLAGKPMLHYTIDTLNRIPIDDINVVVGYRATDVKASIGQSVKYVYQEQQLGTAHAVKLAVAVIHPAIKNIIVVNCDDSAFYEASTLRAFIDYHLEKQSPVSVISVKVADPTGLGRIIRDSQGKLEKIVEEKDASDKEKTINEINTGCYIFDASWVRENIGKINPSDKDGEYYLPLTIQLALKQKHQVSVYPLENSREWLPVNTRQELNQANQAMLQKMTSINTPTISLIDLDNTLLNTNALKLAVPQHLFNKIHGVFNLPITLKQVETAFYQIYESIRQKEGYINIPTIAKELAKHFALGSSGPVKDVLYSLPFKAYLFNDSLPFLEFLSRWSQVVIIGDGDLVYEPIKYASLQIDRYISNVYFAEHKTELIPDLTQIYQKFKLIVVDDQLQALEQFALHHSNLTTIWINDGPYSQQTAISPAFKPNFAVPSLRPTLNIFKADIFAWS